jgi:hypothetical protein
LWMVPKKRTARLALEAMLPIVLKNCWYYLLPKKEWKERLSFSCVLVVDQKSEGKRKKLSVDDDDDSWRRGFTLLLFFFCCTFTHSTSHTHTHTRKQNSGHFGWRLWGNFRCHATKWDALFPPRAMTNPIPVVLQIWPKQRNYDDTVSLLEYGGMVWYHTIVFGNLTSLDSNQTHVRQVTENGAGRSVLSRSSYLSIPQKWLSLVYSSNMALLLIKLLG